MIMKISLFFFAFLYFISTNAQVGIGTTMPDDDLDIVGDVQLTGHLRVGNPTETATTYNGVYETDWQGTISFDENGYRYYDIGNFNYSTSLPASVTVTKIIWEMDGYHEDANEDHGVWVKLGPGTGGTWYGWFGNATNGAKDVNWHYVSSPLNLSWANGSLIRMRVEDDCCFGDEMRVFNMHIKIYYSYTRELQNGEISASGRIYANATEDVGDLAEYFEVDKNEAIDAGHIVVLKPGGDNEYMLSKKPFEQHIVGVISENPSVVLNNPKVGPPVALTGRVKVKLKKGGALIKSGDFLTTSDKPGLAMLAKESGPVIGYAVSNQIAGTDIVEILLQPGRFYFPPKKEPKRDHKDVDGVHSRYRN